MYCLSVNVYCTTATDLIFDVFLTLGHELTIY